MKKIDFINNRDIILGVCEYVVRYILMTYVDAYRSVKGHDSEKHLSPCVRINYAGVQNITNSSFAIKIVPQISTSIKSFKIKLLKTTNIKEAIEARTKQEIKLFEKISIKTRSIVLPIKLGISLKTMNSSASFSYTWFGRC